MIYKNWIRANIEEKIQNKKAPLKITYNPTPFKILKFHDAMTYTMELITKTFPEPYYVALSGGMDSEFIAKTFLRNKIPFKAVIVLFRDNSMEASYAFQFCKNYNIGPVIVLLSDEEYYDIFLTDIFGQYGSQMNLLVPTLKVRKYIDNYGTMFTGNHPLNDEKTLWKASHMLGDFLYQDDIHVCDPMLFTPEVYYSIVKEFDGDDTQSWKSKNFGVDWRPKIRAVLPEKMTEATRLIYQKFEFSNAVEYVGHRDEILAMMESWNA